MFTGLSAFPLTPLDDAGAVDEPAFSASWRASPTRAWTRSARSAAPAATPISRREERARVARLAVEAAGGVPVMVGIGAVRTEHVIAHAHDAQDAGAAAVHARAGLLPGADRGRGLRAVRGRDGRAVGAAVRLRQPGHDPLHVQRRRCTRASRQLPGVAAIKLPGAGRRSGSRALRPRVAGRRARRQRRPVRRPALWTPARTCGSACSAGCSRRPRSRSCATGEPASARLEPLWALFRRHGGVRASWRTAAALLGLAGERNLPRPLRLLDGDARAEVEAALRRWR